MKELIDRINELARASRIRELTPEEIEEQKKLRRTYIDAFKSSLKENLMNLKIVDEDGFDVTPDKLKEEQRKRKLN